MATNYRPPVTGDAFRDRRRSGIGGSDAGAILGVSPFQSALSVWEEKRGLATDESPPSERMVWGTRLEGAILAGYEEDTGRKVRRSGRQMLRSKDWPWVIGHPDGIAEDRLIEVKTAAMLDSRWGDDGTADVPPHYYSQVQHYLILTGLPLADLIVLVGGRELHSYSLPADGPFQSALLEAEEHFWQAVQDGIPPEPDGSESAGATLRRMFPRALPEEIVATPEIVHVADDYLVCRYNRDEFQRAMDLDVQQMQSYMGNRERLVGPHFTATWAERTGSVSWKEAAARYRDLLVPHYSDDALDGIAEATRGEGTRSFSLKTTQRGD